MIAMELLPQNVPFCRVPLGLKCSAEVNSACAKVLSCGQNACTRRSARPIVVTMAQATFSWPFGPIHLESACLRFRLTAKTVPAPLLLLSPSDPLPLGSGGEPLYWGPEVYSMAVRQKKAGPFWGPLNKAVGKS